MVRGGGGAIAGASRAAAAPAAASADAGAGAAAGRRRWQDEELRQLYELYHKHGQDWGRLAAELGTGRATGECEELCHHHQTFLGLPHTPSLAGAFAAMVKDAHNNSGNSGGDGEGAAAAGGDLLRPPAPTPPKATSLAHRLAVDVSGASMQGGPLSPQQGGGWLSSPAPADPGSPEGDDENDAGGDGGDGDGSGGASQAGPAAAGAAAGAGAGSRPQRTRKPRQYIGEQQQQQQQQATPKGTRSGGSLPTTPSSTTRRKGARGGGAAGGRGRRGAAALYGSSGSPRVDTGSAKKRRHRRLFEELQHQQGLAEREDAGGGFGGWGAGGGGEGEHDDDDVEEGVDALLSLASMAHASSSCATDSQAFGDPDGRDHGAQQQGARRSGRLAAWQRPAALFDVAGGDTDGGGGGDPDAAAAAAAAAAADSDAEDAAGGLAAMRGSQGWGTPKGSGFIYRTGTPGGVGRGEFLLASPGISDRAGLPLPSPGGRAGSRGRAAAGARSPSTARDRARPGRGRGNKRGGGRARGGAGGGAAAARAAGGGGRASARARARAGSGGLEGVLSGSLDGGLCGASEGDGEGASDGEPDLMDADELAVATVSVGAALSSPHFRTNSANEPPRSAVLLGKRAFGADADGDTPASHRSVRQRLDGGGGGAGLPFALPQPLFAAGGANAAGAAELARFASEALSGGFERSPQQPGRKAPRRRGEPEPWDEGGGGGTRGTRSSGRARRKQQQPLRNRRKPLHGGQRGLPASGRAVQPRADGAADSAAAAHHHHHPADAALRHMLRGRARLWVGYEWHYAAIDRPFFLRNEMQELLHAAGLSGVTHLTRGEWSVVRGAFGRPRRLSLPFLQEERARLEAYREHVRAAYERAGVGMEVPADLPRPLKVAQAVVARHPATRGLHDGIVLTLKSSKYRVQFNRSELMTEVVRDTDVMPLDPSEALPVSMLHSAHLPQLLNGRPTGAAAAAPPAAQQLVRRRPAQAVAAAAANAAVPPAPQPGVDSGTNRSDQRLLAELSSALDLKEELLQQLRSMNGSAEAGGHLDPATTRPGQAFQSGYASVLAALQGVNSQLQGLLDRLQGRSHLNVPPHAAAAAAAAAAGADATAGALAAAAALLGRTGSAAAAAAHAEATAALASGAPPAALAVAETARLAACDLVRRMRAKQRQEQEQQQEQQQRQQQQQQEEQQPAPKAAGAVAGTECAPPPPMGAAATPLAAAAAAAPEASQLDGVIGGCLALALTLHKLTAPAAPGAGQAPLGAAAAEAALDAALHQLRPRVASNAQVFADISSSVAQLRAQLAWAH